MKKVCAVALVVALGGMFFAVFANEATALEVCSGKIIEIEPNQMPTNLLIKKDCYTPSCGTSTWIYYSGSADNVKAIYAAVLSAIVAGKNLDFYLYDGSCTAYSVHVLQ